MQSAMRRWILTHVTRVWTALFTLAGLGAAFVYKPELLTLYLRTTMTAIERGTAALPYPWGDRLVLLHHKFLRGMFLCIGVAQHGHLDNLLARATLRRMRSVAIEFGTCRWVRNGGASGSVTVGNRKFLERPGGTRSTGGNRLPLGDQESVGGDAQRGVVVEAAPPSALEMP